MNQVINEVPFGEGVIHAYVDTSSGILDIELGQLEAPDLTITLSYGTAKAILVDADAQAALNAFFSGKIKVDGDITKMMALQTSVGGGGANPSAVEMFKRIQAITA